MHEIALTLSSKTLDLVVTGSRRKPSVSLHYQWSKTSIKFISALLKQFPYLHAV
jgi:hypothetical protein